MYFRFKYKDFANDSDVTALQSHTPCCIILGNTAVTCYRDELGFVVPTHNQIKVNAVKQTVLQLCEL